MVQPLDYELKSFFKSQLSYSKIFSLRFSIFSYASKRLASRYVERNIKVMLNMFYSQHYSYCTTSKQIKPLYTYNKTPTPHQHTKPTIQQHFYRQRAPTQQNNKTTQDPCYNNTTPTQRSLPNQHKCIIISI